MKQVPEAVLHSSCMPGTENRQLHRSLLQKQLPPAFLYRSPVQSHLWLDLHQECSPTTNDPGCHQIYTVLAQDAWREIGAEEIVLIGLGCADGQKETVLLEQDRGGRVAEFLAVDVSASMAQAACQAVLADSSRAVVLDLAHADDMPGYLGNLIQRPCRRVISLFGVLPNLEPGPLLACVAGLLRPGDLLMLSANLAPGDDYRAGMDIVLPQYDNAHTRAWLGQALVELDGDPSRVRLEFTIEIVENQYRIAADFLFVTSMNLGMGQGKVQFAAGERLRAFHSFRHTPTIIGQLLATHGLKKLATHVTASGEEGVWLARRQ